MRSILVDTGAIVGLFNRHDRLHAAAERFFQALNGTDRLLTTWPVVTECSFALVRNRAAFFDWLAQDILEVVDFAVADLEVMKRWMSNYADREVDFADATLVWLAGKRDTNLIATTDFNDFEAYRILITRRRSRGFRNLIERP